jgi:CheY-like chemotaxis protein
MRVSKSDARPKAAGLNILVVDDDLNCLASVEEVLEQDGHFITTATAGQEALELARQLRRAQRSLELSILDFNIPDMTGLEIFQLLNLELPEVGAIFISGNTSKTLEEQVLLAGGFALVPKPLDAPRLRRVIKSFAASRGGF